MEQQRIELLGLDGSMERRLRAAALDLGQQVLNLLDRYQDLKERERAKRRDQHCFIFRTQEEVFNNRTLRKFAL